MVTMGVEALIRAEVVVVVTFEDTLKLSEALLPDTVARQHKDIFFLICKIVKYLLTVLHRCQH